MLKTYLILIAATFFEVAGTMLLASYKRDLLSQYPQVF